MNESRHDRNQPGGHYHEQATTLSVASLARSNSNEIPLQPGRLVVKCICGENIRHKEQTEGKTRLTPSIRLTIAPSKAHSTQLYSMEHADTNENPNFEDEILRFDIQDPKDFMMDTDENGISGNGDIRLRVELLNKPQLKYQILGKAETSITNLIIGTHSTSKSTINTTSIVPYNTPHVERLTMLQEGDLSSNSYLFLELTYLPVYEGTLAMTLVECAQLLNVETNEVPKETMCTVQLGDLDVNNSTTGTLSTKDSQTLVDASRTGNPKFPQNGNEKLYLEINSGNWFHDLNISMTEIKKGGSREIFGQGHFSILPLLGMSSKFTKLGQTHTGDAVGTSVDDEKDIDDNITSVSLSLAATKDEQHANAGSVLANLSFSLAGLLTVRNIGVDLLPTARNKLKDSYLQIAFTSKGRASKLLQSTSVLKYSLGNDSDDHRISWKDETIQLPLVDHHILGVEIHMLDAMGTKHGIVGAGEVSLFPVFRRGRMDSTTVTLKSSNEVGAMLKSGDLQLSLFFEGNGPLAYPKFHPSATVVQSDQSVAPSKISPKTSAAKKRNAAAAAVPLDQQVFNDDEINSTFKLLDLDKNGYVGAAELKHVLICMGELVTDEEVDAMIDMCDKNGDGQVGCDAFSIIGKSTNFSDENSVGSMEDKTTTEAGDRRGSGVNDYTIKRMVFSRFVVSSKIHRGMIKIFREFLIQKSNAALSETPDPGTREGRDSTIGVVAVERASWKIDYSTLCRVMSIEPTGEARKVFELLSPDDYDKIDARQLVLGLVNFIPSFSVHEKCQMMLELYDSKKDGTLNFDNLLDILSGNHLKSRDVVNGKAKTMMNVVDRGGTGKLVFDDLLDAATKFPNLFLPKHIGVAGSG